MDTMSKIKYLSKIAFWLAFMFSAIGVATAQTKSVIDIRGIGTGWAQDQFVVYSPALLPAASNPANCAKPDGFGARIDYPGYKTHLSTVQLAFALGKQIEVFVSDTAGDCTADRPRIIGVSVFR
jgi:hypothetical protein